MDKRAVEGQIIHIRKGKVFLLRSIFWIGLLLLTLGIVVGDDLLFWWIPTKETAYLYSLNWKLIIIITGGIMALGSFLVYRSQFVCDVYGCRGHLFGAVKTILSMKTEFEDEYCPRCGQKYRILTK